MRAPVLLSPFNTWQSETPFFEGWREHDPGALIRGKVRSFFVGSSELNSSPASHDPPQGLCQRRSSFWSERGLCLLLSSPGTRKRDEPEYSSTIRSGLIQLLRESSWSSKAWASTFKSFVMESDTCKLDLRLRSIWEDSLMNVLLSPSERLMIFRVWGGEVRQKAVASPVEELRCFSADCAHQTQGTCFCRLGHYCDHCVSDSGEAMGAIHPSHVSETRKGVKAKL